jgi:lysyl-tRNA synthetase class 2
MQNLAKILHARSLLKTSIRTFFEKRHFLEVDTPVLVKCPGTELHLNYFKTEWVDHYKKTHSLWMRSSPELALKRALASGIPALYQLAPSFRNEGEIGPWHHPEFTMLEFYQVGATWQGFLDLTTELIRFCIDEM